MLETNIHLSLIKSEDGLCYHYLVQNNDTRGMTIYLHGLEKLETYKADITSEKIESIAEASGQNISWVHGMLFKKETQVVWNVDARRAVLIWKKRLDNDMKLLLGTVALEKCSSGPSDMLTICGVSLQRQESQTEDLLHRCQRLDAENAELRKIASDAVTARQQLEDDLISKFALLLNTKKEKIRALQDMLEEQRASEIDDAPAGDDVRPVGGRWPGRPDPRAPGGAAAGADRTVAARAATHDLSDASSDAGSGGGSGHSGEYDQDTDVDDGAADAGGEGAYDAGGEGVYDQDTEVDDGAAGAAAPQRQLSEADSLDLGVGGLDEPLPVRQKRVTRTPSSEPELPPKRRTPPADTDDLLLDIV